MAPSLQATKNLFSACKLETQKLHIGSKKHKTSPLFPTKGNQSLEKTFKNQHSLLLINKYFCNLLYMIILHLRYFSKSCYFKDIICQSLFLNQDIQIKRNNSCNPTCKLLINIEVYQKRCDQWEKRVKSCDYM